MMHLHVPHPHMLDIRHHRTRVVVSLGCLTVALMSLLFPELERFAVSLTLGTNFIWIWGVK